jgi:hypothetical protein
MAGTNILTQLVLGAGTDDKDMPGSFIDDEVQGSVIHTRRMQERTAVGIEETDLAAHATQSNSHGPLGMLIDDHQVGVPAHRDGLQVLPTTGIQDEHTAVRGYVLVCASRTRTAL